MMSFSVGERLRLRPLLPCGELTDLISSRALPSCTGRFLHFAFNFRGLQSIAVDGRWNILIDRMQMAYKEWKENRIQVYRMLQC